MAHLLVRHPAGDLGAWELKPDAGVGIGEARAPDMEKVLGTEYTGVPIYANCLRMDVPMAEDIERRLVNLPSSPVLVRA